jgi:hypothetical protein
MFARYTLRATARKWMTAAVQGRQPIDSTYVLANIRVLNRTLCFDQKTIYVSHVLSEVSCK